MQLSLSVLLSFLLTFSLLYFGIPILSKYLLDIPNERSSHSKAVPTGCGIFLSFIISIFLSINNHYYVLICLPIAIIGFIDDLKPLSSKLRYCVQLLISYFIIQYFSLLSELKSFNYFFCLIFLLLFITAIINFFNFIDGVDGLIGSNLLIYFLLISLIISPVYLIVFGSLLAFLYFNWQPAKVFLGDSGSTFLGALTACTIFYDTPSIDKTILMICSLSALLIDPFTCVIRRLLYGENIFQPHKLFLFQRLVQAGFSHSRVSLIYSGVSLVLFIAILSDKVIFVYSSFISSIIFGIYLDRFVAVSFKDALYLSKKEKK
tara:strand:+ start:2114 stop:3070 length:957 start_codon:yes stop_codon:yes gene_type:complete